MGDRAPLPNAWRRFGEVVVALADASENRRFAAALWYYHGNASPRACHDLVGPPPDPSLLFRMNDPRAFIDTWFPRDRSAWIMSRWITSTIVRWILCIPLFLVFGVFVGVFAEITTGRTSCLWYVALIGIFALMDYTITMRHFVGVLLHVLSCNFASWGPFVPLAKHLLHAPTHPLEDYARIRRIVETYEDTDTPDTTDSEFQYGDSSDSDGDFDGDFEVDETDSVFAEIGELDSDVEVVVAPAELARTERAIRRLVDNRYVTYTQNRQLQS